MIISFEISEDDVFIKIIVECLLLDRHLNNFFRTIFLRNGVGHLVLEAFESYLQIDVVLEHVLRGIEVILEIFDI